MKKLVCDRCQKELTDKDDVEMALEGMEIWQAAVRARGAEPRGIYPCENFIRCGGEMKLVTDNMVLRYYRWLRKLLASKEVWSRR